VQSFALQNITKTADDDDNMVNFNLFLHMQSKIIQTI